MPAVKIPARLKLDENILFLDGHNLSNFTPASRLSISGPVILRLLSIFGRTVATVFNMASGYSLGLSRTFEKAFSKAGGVLLDILPYTTKQPRFRELMERIRSIRPDALCIAGHGESAPCSKRGNDEPALLAVTGRAQNNIQIAKGLRQNVRNNSI